MKRMIAAAAADILACPVIAQNLQHCAIRDLVVERLTTKLIITNREVRFGLLWCVGTRSNDTRECATNRTILKIKAPRGSRAS